MKHEREAHEDPATEYERMLERAGLDCSQWGCWRPIAAFVQVPPKGEIGFCAEHARLKGGELRWLPRQVCYYRVIGSASCIESAPTGDQEP